MKPASKPPRVFFAVRDIAPAAVYWQRADETLSDAALANAMRALREETVRGARLQKRLPRILGAAGECCRRKLGLTPFPVQYLAAASLVAGEIAQMNTGEGKTLTAVLAACCKALEGRGVHVITVNEYLARRDFEQNRPVFEALGLTAGLSLSGMTVREKQDAYNADITYTTATEAGFDRLRDGVAPQPSARVQRELYYAIVDEADSILLDEAVTPMILSGGGTGDLRDYKAADTFARYLKPAIFDSLDDETDPDTVEGDYVVDRKRNSAVLTAAGVEKAERYYRVKNLFDLENLPIYHRILQAISAYGTLERDKDYIVRDGKVCIVDRNTGRVMEGRRYAAGLHQAVEAREGVEIHQESRVIASITYQKFFSLYGGLCGMTGTAWTSRKELSNTYHARVRKIPPNRPCVRVDRADRCFETTGEKLEAVAKDVEEARRAGRPVLVGTPNDRLSEEISRLLAARGVPHAVLGAKQDADEAAMVARAGLPGSVMVATNMAGRGTDIRLGDGDPAVWERVCRSGGLLVIGTERQRSRRVDDQLIGRSGRQGDPGESRFFVSAEDEVLRLFGPERREGKSAKLPDARFVRRAQRSAESADAGQRAGALEADNVLQAHREHVLADRERILMANDPAVLLRQMIASTVRLLRAKYGNEAHRYADFRIAFCRVFGNDSLPPPTQTPVESEYVAGAESVLRRKEDEAPGVFDEMARAVMLQTVDEAWSGFLEAFEELKTGYHLMAMGKSSPRNVLIQYSSQVLDEANEYILREGMRRVFCCRLTRKQEETTSRDGK